MHLLFFVKLPPSHQNSTDWGPDVDPYPDNPDVPPPMSRIPEDEEGVAKLVPQKEGFKQQI